MQSINICDISSIKECIKTVKCIFGNKSQSQKKERSIDTKLKCLMSGPECDRKSMQRYHNPASVCRAFKNGQEVNAEIIHSQSFLLIHLFKCSVMQIFDQTITCYEYNTFRPVYWTACVYNTALSCGWTVCLFCLDKVDIYITYESYVHDKSGNLPIYSDFWQLLFEKKVFLASTTHQKVSSRCQKSQCLTK